MRIIKSMMRSTLRLIKKSLKLFFGCFTGGEKLGSFLFTASQNMQMSGFAVKVLNAAATESMIRIKSCTEL